VVCRGTECRNIGDTRPSRSARGDDLAKAYVMERERFDGADVAHLLASCGEQLSWKKLLRRFGPNWRVLLSHLALFGFIFSAQRKSHPEKRAERSHQPIYQ
jgi:hypothetical protein